MNLSEIQREVLLKHGVRLAPDDPALIVVTINELMLRDALARVEAARDQPVADIERAARAALIGLRPALERRWRWQRWAVLAGVFIAGCVVMGLVNAAVWSMATTVARRQAAADDARWWAAICTDPSHRAVVAGVAVCQVPMQGPVASPSAAPTPAPSAKRGRT